MLANIVEEALKKKNMLQAGQTIAAALSGGRDSVCLLHILHLLAPKIPFKLMAVHVNHGLREEAEKDEAFCKQLCEKWEIPLYVARVDVPKRVRCTGESVEEAARKLRYNVFEELVESGKAQRIILAHHQQDQAETVLLHLLRGSGLTGLCGMRQQRLPYVRPMLEASSEDIDAYREENCLEYIEDASNQDTIYRRNKIRHELLPLLRQEYNPEIVKALAQMAEQLQAEEDYLDQQIPAQIPDPLVIAELLRYPYNLQKRILRKWLKQNGLVQDVQQIHVQQLLDLCKGQTGRRISLPKGLTAYKSYDILVIRKCVPCQSLQQGFPSWEMEYVTLAEAQKQWKNCQQVPALPEEKWLCADFLTQKPIWRTRKTGDYIVIKGGHKKLKEFLIDAKIPREERDVLPLLTDGSHVLWIWGYRISDAVKITENTQQVLHVRRITNDI